VEFKECNKNTSLQMIYITMGRKRENIIILENGGRSYTAVNARRFRNWK
jgi:hypothetical protein